MYVTVVPLLWQEIKRHSAKRLARHFGQSLTELRGWRVNCVIIRWWIDGTLNSMRKSYARFATYCGQQPECCQ